MTWAELSDSELLRTAEAHDFQLMIAADKDMVYQQNNETRTIRLLVLDTNRLRHFRSRMGLVLDAADRVSVGSFESVILLDLSE